MKELLRVILEEAKRREKDTFCTSLLYLATLVKKTKRQVNTDLVDLARCGQVSYKVKGRNEIEITISGNSQSSEGL